MPGNFYAVCNSQKLVKKESYILVPQEYPKVQNNKNNVKVKETQQVAFFSLNPIKTDKVDNYLNTKLLPPVLSQHVLEMKRLNKDIYVKLDDDTYRLDDVLNSLDHAMASKQNTVLLKKNGKEEVVSVPFTDISAFLANVLPATEKDYTDSLKHEQKPQTSPRLER